MGCAADCVAHLCLGFRFSPAGCFRCAAISLSQGGILRGCDLPAGDCGGAGICLSCHLGLHVFHCETRARPRFLAGYSMELAETLVKFLTRRYGAVVCVARDRTRPSYAERTPDGSLLPDARRSLGLVTVWRNFRAAA